MRSVELYIAGHRVDLDDQSFILFTYTMDDLTNPVVVKNSFSKQITLKGTSVNNKIFGDIFRSDRKTRYGDVSLGINFDVMRRTPFAIYDDMNNILESGYLKLDSIENDNGRISYKVTLYGGLGAFFYELSYNEEGEKRTLNDLTWKYYDGHEGVLTPFTLTKEVLVNKAWKYVEQGNAYLTSNPSEYWDILNFAPAYNGLPGDFDADKILMQESSVTENGTTYRFKEGCTSCLVKMEKTHTEWEVRNIRPYLQRPVVSVKGIINAIVIEAKKKGYQIQLDETFFYNSNRYYNRGWITLPMISKEHRNSSDVVSSILSSSLTPCEYLLGIAKTFGLVFTYDKTNKVISITRRDVFYTGEVLDFSQRVSKEGIEINPLMADSKWFQFGGDKVVGEDAISSGKSYGRPYAVKKVNTGYEFNSDISNVTKDIPFITAADVIEKNMTNALLFYGGVGMWSEVLPSLRSYETLKKTLYNANGESKEFDMARLGSLLLYYDDNYPYEDWLPKVQFHAEDNKASAGEHCLLLMVGNKTCPTLKAQHSDAQGTLTYYVSDDHPDTEVLNGGKPCWNLATDKVIAITNLPSFRRTMPNDTTMEWGAPIESFTHDSWDSLSPIYDKYWKTYIADRYNADTRVMRCNIDLSGLEVGQNLMRKFVWYDNAIWVINKIENYSLTTEHMTPCELVKVQDMLNYTKGQL